MIEKADSRGRMIEVAIGAFRQKGYSDTTVDDICAAAGVSKGSFFHHFKSKEDLALASIDHWNAFTGAVFDGAAYQQLDDPLDRVLGYVDFRIAILEREVSEFTCLLGTLVQETYLSHPTLRQACDAGMSSHVAMLASDLEAARRLYAPDATWSGESVGYFIQSVLQGSFIFAKAKGGADIARSNLELLRRFLIDLMPTTKP